MTFAKFLPPTTESNLTAGDVIAMLAETGFEPCGSGFDAQAYIKDDRVVKVVCGNAGHRAAVETFIAHPDLDGFPTIYGEIIDLSDGCFVYEMERLFPSYDGPCGGCGVVTLEDALEGHESEWETNAEWLIENIGHREMELLLEACPSDWIDLHENNRMERDCGQIVALDPFHLGGVEDRNTRRTINEAHGTYFTH